MAHYDRKDKYYKKAKDEGYVARSIYKLEEMSQKYGLFKKAKKVVDLGCAPGGWLQLMEKKLPGVKVVGIDLSELAYEPAPHIHFIQGDFLEKQNQEKILSLLGGYANVILSDLAPHLSGIKFKDTMESLELAQMAFDFSKNNLSPNGHLVIKLFPSQEASSLINELKRNFKNVHQFVPDATRQTSKEIYLVCLEKK